MKLTQEEVQKIATLARLEFKPDELDKFAAQLSSILDYVEKLSGLDTADVEPTSHTLGQSTPQCHDQNVQSDTRDRILDQAPGREDTLFKVPKVLT